VLDATTTTDALQTIFIGGQLLLIGLAAVFGWRQLAHAKHLRDAQTRPFVVIDLGSSRQGFFDLVVTNVGSTMARNVAFEFNPPMVTSKRYTDIYELKAFKDGISTLPPGKEFRTLLDFGPPRYKEKLPDVYRVKVSYQGDPGDRPYAEEMDLDFGLYWNRRSITLRDIHDVYKQLEIIANEMQHWRPGIGSGLLTVSPKDVQKRHDQAERDLEEFRAEQTMREHGAAHEVSEDEPDSR
jgi:hypothetical protein